jgi:hypothetical protein
MRDNLDGADLSRQVRKDGGLIARTRTDFEHNMIGRDLGQLGHQGHDERLRYGLAGPIGIGLSAYAMEQDRSGMNRWRFVCPMASRTLSDRPCCPKTLASDRA